MIIKPDIYITIENWTEKFLIVMIFFSIWITLNHAFVKLYNAKYNQEYATVKL